MTKLLKFLCIIISVISLNVFAEEKIDYLYLNSDTDILGSFHIKEAIVFDGSSINVPIIYKPYTKKQTNDNLEDTTFYNARGVKVKCVNYIETDKDKLSMKILDNACKGKNVKYKEEQTKDGIILNIKGTKTKKQGIYIIDYFIDQAVLTHKDISEINFPFINDLDYEIKNVQMQVLLSGYSEKFKFWSHSSGKGEILPVGEKKKNKNYYKGVYLKLKNVPANSKTTVRMLFDKALTKMPEKILTNSNKNMYEKITKLENQKIKETEKQEKMTKLKSRFVKVSTIIYIAGLIFLLYYFLTSKFDLKIMIFYLVLGLIIFVIHLF